MYVSPTTRSMPAPLSQRVSLPRALLARSHPLTTGHPTPPPTPLPSLFLLPSPLFHLVILASRPSAPLSHLMSPSPRLRTNNQVDVEQRASRALSFSIRPRCFPPSRLSRLYLRFCPRVYVNHCSGAVCVLYIRRRMYLHDNIIPFLAYVDWLFFFVIDCPTGCFTSPSRRSVPPWPLSFASRRRALLL